MLRTERMIKIFSFGWLLLLAGMVLSPLIFLESGTVSKENRTLAAFPPLSGSIWNISRSFTLGVENWLNDHIGFRSALVEIYGRLHVNILRSSPHPQLLLGKDGYVDLASHSAAPSSYYSHIKTVFHTAGAEQKNAIASNLVELKKKVDAWGAANIALLIPQKPLLDHDLLPKHVAGLAAPAMLARPLPQEIASMLPKEADDWLLYPYDEEVLRDNREHSLYPRKNFHWVPGKFTALVAARIAARFGLSAEEASLADDAYAPRVQYSDLSHFAGFTMADSYYWGLKADVLPSLGIFSVNIETMYPQIAEDVRGAYAFFTNQMKKHKVLLVGCSFSPAIAGDLAGYFGQALCIDVLSVSRRLAPGEEAARNILRKILLVYNPDYIVVSGHAPYILTADLLTIWPDR